MCSRLIGECDHLLGNQATWALVLRIRIFAHFTLFPHRRSAVKLISNVSAQESSESVGFMHFM